MMDNTNNYIVPIVGGPEPGNPSIAMLTQEWIRNQIAAIIDSKQQISISIRDAVQALDVFPLLEADSYRWYGLRPNGDLLLFELHSPYHSRVEANQWKRTAVIFKASLQYPELKVIVPSAPLNAAPCFRCGGLGYILLKDERTWCICEGLGWVSPMFDEGNNFKTRNDLNKMEGL